MARRRRSPDSSRALCRAGNHQANKETPRIHFELWIPANGWNGKYLQLGNGGWAGAINAAGLAEPVKRGYAAAATDDGHQGGAGATWAIGHPEKLIDFGYRAVHETNLQSKAIIRALLGRAPSRSYFNGCSDGGREALMEAQRYAEDFDGIIAGAPASDWSHLFTGFIWNARALTETPGSAIPPAKLPLIQKAVLVECDAADGVKDGLLQDPRACHFDPSVLTCKDADGPGRVPSQSAAGRGALRKIYDGPRNPRTGTSIFPGYARGTEAGPAGWSAWIAPASVTSSVQYGFGSPYYGQAVFEDPKWDYRNLNFDTDVAFGDQKAGPVLNAINPDLQNLPCEWRKTDSVSRLGRSGDLTAQLDRLLRQCASVSRQVSGCETSGFQQHAGVLSSVHGSGHGPLRGRCGSEQLWKRRLSANRLRS